MFHLDDEIRIDPHVWIGCPRNADFMRTGLYKPSDVSGGSVGTVTAYLHIIHEDREFDITGPPIIGPDPDPVQFYWAFGTWGS